MILFSTIKSMIIFNQSKLNICTPRNNRMKIITEICVVVFALAILLVIIVIPLDYIAIRKPVTNKSRNIIKATIQYGIKSNIANEMKAELTSILSAKGSRN